MTTPNDRCQYCGHTRAQHNRPEPGNPPPSLRCGSGCVCHAFIERSGKPDYLELNPNAINERQEKRRHE